MKQQNHHFKPKARFHGAGPWYLGLELEFEAPDHDKRAQGLGVLHAPRCMYAKRDGSLADTGWELVTHPISPELWLDPRPSRHNSPVARFTYLVGQLKGLGYTSHDNSRCGLHLHVSHAAFERPTLRREYNWRSGLYELTRAATIRGSARLYWFTRLVNGSLFARLSQRRHAEINQWARQVPVPAKLIGRTTDKYRAVHVTDKTVEVRIFRGNMREDRIRKAVEAVIAAVEFAGTLTSKDWADAKAGLDGLFTAWVRANATRFPNLAAYLTELERAARPVVMVTPEPAVIGCAEQP